MSQLRNKFENRAMDVLYSRADTSLTNLKIFFEFLNGDLLLRSIFEELSRNLPNPETLVLQMKTTKKIILPSIYLEKVRACLSILLHLVEKNEEPWHMISFSVSRSRNADTMTEEVMKEFFVPICNYFEERIASLDSFQYILTRFKLRAEWFSKESLFDLYKKDESKGESVLDRMLRSYLFDEGINFPFSKPSSPSGEVDVLSVVDQKPIPLEIKVYDANGRSQSHIRQGLRQAFNYSRDYGEPSAYLVVFNVSENDLAFELNLKDIPQRLIIGDKTIYIFTVNLFPHEESASKRDLKRVVIDEKYLLETN